MPSLVRLCPVAPAQYNTVKFKKSAAVAVFDKLVEDEKKLQREKSAKKAQKAAEEEARKAKAKQASYVHLPSHPRSHDGVPVPRG